MRRTTTILLAVGLVATACSTDGTTPETSAPATTVASTATTSAPSITAATTTTSSAAQKGSWFDSLETGACFNDVWVDDEFDFSVPPAITPCAGPHDNEVVALIDLPNGDFPSTDEVVADAEAACEVTYGKFFGGSDRATEFMSTWSIPPNEADWTAGARVAACVTYAGAPVTGTARSAGLTAPGTVLAVVHEIDANTDVWTLDGATGELLVNVSNTDLLAQLTPPSWSPDGTAILYAAGARDEDRRIWAGAPDGTEPRPLLGGLAVKSVGSPVVDPTNKRMIAVIAALNDGEFDIHLYDGNADTLQRLTDNADRDTSPNWSPDGSKIAYRARIDGNSDIWVMDATGSNKMRLTTDAGFDGDPRWSPDGSQLLFTSDRTGDFEIWVMDADGSNQQNLTNHPGADEYPDWSPDGSVIAFQSDRHGGVSLWLMRADGSDQSDLSWMGPIGYPSFAPSS